MNAAVAVILAAGRGSRMRSLTDERPKCLTELSGAPLLHWQLGALRQGGVGELAVVTGYLGHLLEPDARGDAPAAYRTLNNPQWARTNMLSTLLAAGPWLNERFAAGAVQAVVSYADIVYHPSHVAALLAAGHDLAITYDTLWEPLWRLRFGDPLCDAETFSQQGGLLAEIGGRPKALADIQGQYMGLMKVSAAGWPDFKRACEELGPAVASTDMTAMLSHLLGAGARVGAVPVCGKWCEVDSGEDLEKYARALQGGGWTHDWRA
jgi:L-glutamine-phosphate cytidylyltransferase